MGVETIGSGADIHPHLVDDLLDDDEGSIGAAINLDARRKLEDKIEELRLKREMQEFDFDI